MIGQFGNIKTQTGFPVKNEIKIAPIRSLFISDRDFYFENEAAFETQSNWITAIKNQDLSQVLNLIEQEDQSEPDQYNISDLDYEYYLKHGKYKFTFRAPYRLDYHQNLSQWSGRPMRIYFGDYNKNVYGTSLTSHVYGFDVELFQVEKKIFQIGSVPAWTTIKLVLALPEEFNENGVVSNVSWNPNKNNTIFVTISSITGSGTTIDVTVKDSVYDIFIEGLLKTDFTITDNGGALTISSLVSTGIGTYRLTASGTVTFGTLQINTNYFYSAVTNYYVNVNICLLQNFVWETQKKFKVNVVRYGLLTAVAGLTSSDFALTDDIEGVCNITAFTESPSGTYEITVAEDLTEGDLVVDDAAIDGTAPYTTQIEAKFENFTSTGTNIIVCKISTVVSDADITGLVLADFEVTDDNHGEIDVLSVVEGANSYYTLTLDEARTIGDIIIEKSVYYGSGAYDFSGVLILNGGGTGTTDFVDSNSDGLANSVAKINGTNCTATIVTDTYLTGNVQKLVHNTGVSAVGLAFVLNYFKFNTSYYLRVKYRTNNAGTSGSRFTKVMVYGKSAYVNEDIEPSTGYYTVWESESFVITDDTIITVALTFAKISMELLIDTIELIEV